jgi:hypothetical protein
MLAQHRCRSARQSLLGSPHAAPSARIKVRGLCASVWKRRSIQRRYLDITAVYGFPIQPIAPRLLSSSAVERSAVNRLVVGSNPTSGASPNRTGG